MLTTALSVEPILWEYVLDGREAIIQVVNWLLSLPTAHVKTKGQEDFSTPSLIFLYWINQWFGEIEWTNFLGVNINAKTTWCQLWVQK